VLGRVITHVRCSLAAEEDQQRGAPPVIDRTAAFLAVGAAVYEVRGYSPSCRLAAYLHGRLQVYLAQTTVHHHIEPLPCRSVERASRVRQLQTGLGKGRARVQTAPATRSFVLSFACGRSTWGLSA
jgi:hypothetical protein